MMISLLLLIFSMITGCVLMTDGKNCTGGWVDILFNNTETKGNYQMTYGNHTNYILTVITRKPMNEKKNITENHCDELKLVKSDCIKPFNQTGYITAKVTIRCDYPKEEYKSLEMFFCKDNNSICEDILPPQSHQKWTFTNNSQGFNMSISNVSLEDEGVYWCGVKLSNGYALKKIRLEVKISATSSPTTESSATVSPNSGLLVEPVTLTLVCLSVLLFPVVLILIYKHKNTGTGTAPQRDREDCTYERIQEELRKIDSKNLENPSELAEYATVNFQGCFDTVQPSTTACEYATVKFGRYPTSGSVI